MKLNLSKGAKSDDTRIEITQLSVTKTRAEKVKSFIKTLLSFLGPGYMVAVGYMDPGNWATDLSGGSQFGYSLLFVILVSNVMAVVLQSLAVRLGVVTGCDLAQACKKYYPKWVNVCLYFLCEIAIIACDLAEVIGSAIALQMLFGLPLPWGVVITTFDVFLILLANRSDSKLATRFFEGFIFLLVMGVGICFIIQLVYVKPVLSQVMMGFLPTAEILTNSKELYVAIGIVGATVMPHNLYLHSHIVKLRSPNSNTVEPVSSQKELNESVQSSLMFSIVDCVLALTFALFVNSAILVVASGAFHYGAGESKVEVADLFDAHQLLTKSLGSVAGVAFALALLLSGQSSTITGTMAGQIIMEGFLGLTMRPWLRRIITRGLAIVPAMAVAVLFGSKGMNQVLIGSQVILSLQLPFAVIPLVMFTSSKRVMRVPYIEKNEEFEITTINSEEPSASTAFDHEQMFDASEKHFASNLFMKVVTWLIALIIVGLNGFLLLETARGATL
ncbi:natural resistance-associated macrophage protein [Basidiobolus meristosporus CBS 931.73]|uniref:Natural resistance-associated macrophage protein n=1 Tax=Basidiobolus meristosporus CBS 931.73 TaxID=1314790 RepID=A0A1Y1YMU8_9FUNG|nr:natural resistance-associated macrophage protein [Basidiobolus meristosporus CBS 931.73]|eukprot:ORX99339.1 natural resistance-associated macrophage protein [Basidiobolus meristosporus CBS 931.73]